MVTHTHIYIYIYYNVMWPSVSGTAQPTWEGEKEELLRGSPGGWFGESLATEADWWFSFEITCFFTIIFFLFPHHLISRGVFFLSTISGIWWYFFSCFRWIWFNIQMGPKIRWFRWWAANPDREPTEGPKSYPRTVVESWCALGTFPERPWI